MPSCADTLRRAALLHSLTEADQQALVVCFRPREFRRGERLFREGDPGGSLLVVADGILVVTRAGRGRDAFELGRIGSGELCGEMAFLDPAPRCATVTAATPTSGYAIEVDALDVLRHRAPAAMSSLVRNAFRVVTGRLAQIRDRMQAEIDP